jgi:integrase
MHDCGLRFGEAVYLMWNDGSVDFINSKITIKNKPSKNGLPPFTIKDHETRSIPCTTRVIESLKELKKISIHNNPYVFLSNDRFETVKANWQELVEKGKEDKWLNSMMLANPHRKFVTYCTKAGIHTSERLFIHCLRKSFGTNLSDLGTPVHTLKDLMGHSNIQTTMSYYIKSSDANKMKAVEGLEKLAVG